MTDYSERVADDSDPLRSILRALRDWSGPPPTVAMGRKVVTTHTYDRANRLVRTESDLWTSEDLDLVLALAVYEGGVCGGCGGHLSETTDVRHDQDGEEPYEELSVVACHRCIAREMVARSHESNKHPDALRYVIGLKEPAA